MTLCRVMLRELDHQDDAWPFLEPVGKYFKVVKQPMDSVVLQELPALLNFTSRPARAASPTQLHQSSCKSCQPYSTSPVVLQELPALLNSTSRPARAASPTQLHQSSCKSCQPYSTSHQSSYKSCQPYSTSPVVLQKLPALLNFTSRPARAASPTLLHQSSYKSCQPYTTSPVVPQELPHPTLLHWSSHKNSHILHYFTGCPTRTPTSYTTSPAILQEFPHLTLPHQLPTRATRL